jgi:hypothetical protein
VAVVIEGGCMKRVLIGLLVLLGLIVGCEKEVIKEYPRDGYYGRGYPREGYPRGERRREYRLSDEAIQNAQTEQIDAEIQE